MSQPLPKKTTLELFCGTKSFSKVAEARGHETFTVDIESRFEPDLVADILSLKVADLPERFQHPNIVWASPPCQCYSVMCIGKNWETKTGKYPIPKRPEAEIAFHLAKHTVELIREMKPDYFFIENPRAMLRKMPFMQGLHRSFVTYCQYGDTVMKPTDIWNNCLEWKPRSCKPMASCHERAPRGAHAGLQGKGRSMSWDERANRAIVPARLCEEILIACEASS